MHLLSGYYYYDYLVIGVLRPLWFTEILYGTGLLKLLLSEEVKQVKIIIIIIIIISLTHGFKLIKAQLTNSSQQMMKPMNSDAGAIMY